MTSTSLPRYQLWIETADHKTQAMLSLPAYTDAVVVIVRTQQLLVCCERPHGPPIRRLIPLNSAEDFIPTEEHRPSNDPSRDHLSALRRPGAASVPRPGA